MVAVCRGILARTRITAGYVEKVHILIILFIG